MRVSQVVEAGFTTCRNEMGVDFGRSRELSGWYWVVDRPECSVITSERMSTGIQSTLLKEGILEGKTLRYADVETI